MPSQLCSGQSPHLDGMDRMLESLTERVTVDTRSTANTDRLDERRVHTMERPDVQLRDYLASA